MRTKIKKKKRHKVQNGRVKARNDAEELGHLGDISRIIIKESGPVFTHLSILPASPGNEIALPPGGTYSPAYVLT